MTQQLLQRRVQAARAIGPALKGLARDARGATVIEFAMVAPVVGLILLGAFDVAHTLYARGVLQGIVQKTARDATLEGGGAAAMRAKLDSRVTAQVKAMANNADIKITRRYYRTFSEAAAAKAEIWTDTNKNKTCDDGEPFEDANLNNVWDKDGGNAGQGGAKDTVVYTVEATYPRFFPLYNMIGGSNVTTIKGTTVLRNQPFGDQESYGAMKPGNCPWT
jgi:Flp pilus assembly protein TadG